MSEPLRPDVPGPVSRLYGARERAREGPLHCACGLGFDTAIERDAHWARPMRCAPGHAKGRRVRHGQPRLPATTHRMFGTGPLLRDGEQPRRGPWSRFAPDAPRCPWVRYKPSLLRPRRHRVRVRAPVLPPSNAWRARGKATPSQHRPPPPLPPPPEPRDWTLTPGAATVPNRVSHGLVTAHAWERVSASSDDASDAWPPARAAREAMRVRQAQWPAALTVTTADVARVAALKRQWARPGRWCLVDARPDPTHGRLWRVTAGKVVRPDRRRRTPSSQLRASAADTTIVLRARYSAASPGEAR